jgi:hypothetical protein
MKFISKDIFHFEIKKAKLPLISDKIEICFCNNKSHTIIVLSVLLVAITFSSYGCHAIDVIKFE